MDSRPIESFDDLPSVETPEDVAVLYSWANLHGAKYRDFSASRREYRAQLRHRAAEQARDVELQAHADAEAAVFAAENARKAAEVTAANAPDVPGSDRMVALRHAEEAAQIAAAERIEAARRAEAAAEAEALARREEREIAEANASARRQAAVYAEADSRRRLQASPDASASEMDEDLPGEISDPYPTSQRPSPPVSGRHGSQREPVQAPPRPQPAESPRRYSAALDLQADASPYAAELTPPAPEQRPSPPAPQPAEPPRIRRPQGYRPDDASGVRQIYRGNDHQAASQTPSQAARLAGERSRSLTHTESAPEPSEGLARRMDLRGAHPRDIAHLADETETIWTPAALAPSPGQVRPSEWTGAAVQNRPQDPASPAPARAGYTTAIPQEPRPSTQDSVAPRSDAPAAGHLDDPTPRRRRQDQAGYRLSESDRALAAYRREQAQGYAYANASPRAAAAPLDTQRARKQETSSTARPEPLMPAWIDEQTGGKPAAKPAPSRSPVPSATPSVSDTLQRSRERVASRWFALKGVFEQPGQERPEPQPVRQKETRTPVFAVFSLAGGVGKTSLVATVGRSLSSLGEKVLLTDTTSHGLLPFYFGASELREGTVRTFSPPSGSTDAPIYLVNFAVDQSAGTEETQEALVEQIATAGRGAHRILLDLTASTGWLIRRMARLNPTVLVPLAPDMNSVISLQAIEKFLHGVNGPDGTSVKIFYVLNQFDASLPLHLDVREVLRRQLGDRLLPFVIRRAPAVSEALAEGMTIVDYSSDAPVTEDYMNIANWLRTISAPATAGFRNVRWSER